MLRSTVRDGPPAFLPCDNHRVNSLIGRVRETIAKHVMLTRRDRVLVGVSGGADSTALLLALRELGYEIGAAHLNHGLRGAQSDEDQRFVQELSRELGVAY